MDKVSKIMQEKQKNRINVLIHFYENGATNLGNTLMFDEVIDTLGINEKESEEILLYLSSQGKNYIKWYGSGNAHLTAQGLTYVESIIAAMQPKEQPTPSVVHNYHSPVGAVQTGNYNTANVKQNIGTHTTEILKQISDLRQSFQNLPSEQKEEATELVDGVEQEVKSDKPRVRNIKALLESAKDFAVDTAQKILIEAISKGISGQS